MDTQYPNPGFFFGHVDWSILVQGNWVCLCLCACACSCVCGWGRAHSWILCVLCVRVRMYAHNTWAVHTPRMCGFTQLTIRPPLWIIQIYSRAGPPEMPLRNWYKTFPPDHIHLVEMKNPTRLSNKTSTAWSCAEDQILENQISGTGF